MNSNTLTIRLDNELANMLAMASKRTGKSKSEIARLALARQLRLEQFEDIRRKVMPFAEARGFLTDEDIFSQIS
jgi:predicted transcriptional regulator